MKSDIIIVMASGKKDTKVLGRIGEEVASDFLVRKGFLILDRNYRRPWGEIDIIALKDGIVRFVEVKALATLSLPNVSREKDDYRPEEQVHEGKLRKIVRTAETYMNANRDSREYQIDVVGVYIDTENRRARCRLFEQVL